MEVFERAQGLLLAHTEHEQVKIPSAFTSCAGRAKQRDSQNDVTKKPEFQMSQSPQLGVQVVLAVSDKWGAQVSQKGHNHRELIWKLVKAKYIKEVMPGHSSIS